ncbi:CAP-Gly domain-containing linker protein 3-like isoform X2 [Oratosquilla oratoria]|uniref:CAP-Gly domain-containing linker protein 3-like isoform X2 n=1 Tax=Oratosquilla oratoria TaxID=337810 RepID=UPI003F777700
MVVAGGSPLTQDTCENNLTHYLGSQYPCHRYLKGGTQPPHPQYLPRNQYKGGGSSSFTLLEEDSDGGSDHSSSGRGSGGSELGSDAERHSSRACDSGRYSADGCDFSSVSSSLSPSSAPNSLPPLLSSGHHGNQNRGGGGARHQKFPGGPQDVTQGDESKGTLRASAPVRPPVTHPAVDAPVCSHCLRLEVSFWDPSCPGCASLLRRSDVTPAHIFAILRQWVPQVQRRVHALVAKALGLGCHVDDRDSLTDMTLLHYAVKAGSSGIGDPTTTQQVVGNLLSLGADPRLRCRWTHMTALHYAAYFDVAPILSVLLQHEKGVPVDDPCLEYDSGTPLHIAASNLSLGAARVLLHHGASVTLHDSKGRTPFQCIPTPDQYDLVPDVQQVISNLRGLLSPVNAHAHGLGAPSAPSPGGSNQGASGKAVLRAMCLKIGDRVLVNGTRTGTLRYVGTTEFAVGLWAGVELETPHGRNNGSVKGVLYFRCPDNYGMFVPVNRLSKIPNVSGARMSRARSTAPRSRAPRGNSLPRGSAQENPRRALSLPPGRVNHPRVDVSKVQSRVKMDIRDSKRRLSVEDRVVVDLSGRGDRRLSGTVRYTGTVHFASGFWIGIDLDLPRGTNDGSVHGSSYFRCRPNHGVFAAPSRVNKYMSSRIRQEQTERAREEKRQEAQWQDPPPLAPARGPATSSRRKVENRHWLEVGHNVFYKNEVGVVKYIGQVQFSDGIWLGLELRKAKGRHDGAVAGVRYFSCKQKHGVMVRPSKVTVRGLNGASLVKPQDYEE